MGCYTGAWLVRVSRTVVVVMLLLACGYAAQAEQKGRLFAPWHLSEWKEKSFKGHTTYTVEKEGERNVLHALSTGTASGLYQKIEVNGRELPLLTWSWKVAQTVAAEDAQRKSGDDFAARVYVVFPGRFFWQTRALVYVYSDKLAVGTVLPSAFTDKVAVIAVESGNRFAGTWRQESRNYGDDYRNYFHAEPPNPVAIGIMTDGDNSGSRAEAWYGDITFAAAKHQEYPGTVRP